MYISNILLNFTPFAQLYNYNRAPSLSVFSLGFNFSKRTFFKVHLFFDKSNFWSLPPVFGQLKQLVVEKC